METSLMFSQHRLCGGAEDSRGEGDDMVESTGWAREGGEPQEGRYGGLSVMLAVKCTLRN